MSEQEWKSKYFSLEEVVFQKAKEIEALKDVCNMVEECEIKANAKLDIAVKCIEKEINRCGDWAEGRKALEQIRLEK